MTKRKIGFIGLGLMGGSIATHVVRSGFPMKVFDLSAAAIERVMEFGAERASSPRDAAEGAAVVITSLPNPSDVEAVALGPDGVLDALGPGMVYIDCSSIDPDTTRRIGAEVERRGAKMLDVPVGKGPPAALDGDLTLMVGGDPDVVASCEDVLSTIGSRRFYCGPLGSGVTMKICNNLLSCAAVALVGEAVAIGAKAGLSADTMLDVMSNTAADNSHLRNGFAERAFNGLFEPVFKLKLAQKDLRLATQLAASLGIPSFMASAAHQVHTLASASGMAEEDQIATMKVYEACSGVPVRR